jgi:hypothetical protein
MLSANLKRACDVAQKVMKLNMEQVLASEVIRRWVGPEKLVMNFCLTPGQYTGDLRKATPLVAQTIPKLDGLYWSLGVDA